MHRPSRAEQHRTDGHAFAAGHLEQAVGDVGCIEVGHHQHVGLALQTAVADELVANLLGQRTVAVHFAVGRDIGRQSPEQARRLGHLARRRRLRDAEVGVREHRHPGFDAKTTHFLRRHQGDFGQLFGVGILVDVRVTDEHRASGQNEVVHRRQRFAPRGLADDVLDLVQMVVVTPGKAADHAIGVTKTNQHGADHGAVVTQAVARNVGGHAAPLHQRMVSLPGFLIAIVVRRIDHLDVLADLERRADAFEALADHLGAPDQDRQRQLFVEDDLHRAQDALVLAFGVNDARRLAVARREEHRTHADAGAVDEALQLLAVGVHVEDRALGDARVHRCLRHRRRDDQDQARIEGLGNQVLGAEGQRLPGIGQRHFARHHLVRHRGNGTHAGKLHLFGDARRADVERAAEDEGEAEDVVDLVGVVRTAGGHDHVRAHLARQLGHDLGGRVREREDDGLGRHLGEHLGFQHAGGREAEEDVRTVDRVGQRTGVGFARVRGLGRLHVGFAADVDHAARVADHHVFAPHPEVAPQVEAGNRRRTSARADHLDLGDVLAHHLQRVEHRRSRNDRRAVLVVVKDRDRHPLLELALDVEALGGLDVFEVHPAERGLERGDHVDQFVGVVLGQFDVEHIDAGELLEQAALAFHHRLAGQRTDVAETENGSAVGDHADEVGARGVERGVVRVFDDRFAGKRDAGRVGQCQVVLVDQCLGRANRNLAGRREAVILKCGLAEIVVHFFHLYSCSFAVFWREKIQNFSVEVTNQYIARPWGIKLCSSKSVVLPLMLRVPGASGKIAPRFAGPARQPDCSGPPPASAGISGRTVFLHLTARISS